MAKRFVSQLQIGGNNLFSQSYEGYLFIYILSLRREEKYAEEGVGSCYLFRLDKEEIVDATRIGGMARFINHSCQPNAYARVIATDRQGTDKHIIILAARDILVFRLHFLFLVCDYYFVFLILGGRRGDLRLQVSN